MTGRNSWEVTVIDLASIQVDAWLLAVMLTKPGIRPMTHSVAHSQMAHF